MTYHWPWGQTSTARHSRDQPPSWAVPLFTTLDTITQNLGALMATEQQVSDAIDQLTTSVDGLITEFKNLPRNSDGSIPADHADAFIARLNAERDKVNTAATPATGAATTGVVPPNAPPQ